MVNPIDLNCDMGESFGAYHIGADEEMLQYISSANIACGAHAGDPLVMEQIVTLAKSRGVGIGAHPGYPDLQGFGRRSLDMSPAEIEAYVLYQIGALYAFAKSHAADLAHVKVHGQLYNDAVRKPANAAAVARAVARFSRSLVFVALAGSLLAQAGEEAGLKVAREAFADRAYEADGNLRSRRLPGALITDPTAAARQVVEIVTQGTVTTYTGEALRLEADTICIHGDTVTAPQIAPVVRQHLAEEGVPVAPLSRIFGQT